MGQLFLRNQSDADILLKAIADHGLALPRELFDFLFEFLWEQSRHPARRQCRRENQAQRRTRAVGDQHAALYQGRDDAAGMSLARADDTRSVTAREFSPIQHGFENACRFGRESSKSHFFFRPQNDLRTKPLWLDSALTRKKVVEVFLSGGMMASELDLAPTSQPNPQQNPQLTQALHTAR